MRIEQVTYEIDWSKFHKGYSFFVPCIDHDKARMDLNETIKRLQMQVFTKVTIEDGIKGLRVWRL